MFSVLDYFGKLHYKHPSVCLMLTRLLNKCPGVAFLKTSYFKAFWPYSQLLRLGCLWDVPWSCVYPSFPSRGLLQGGRLHLQHPCHSFQGLWVLGGFSEHSNKQELEQEVIVGKMLCNNEHSTIKPNIQVRESSCMFYWVLEKKTGKKKKWSHEGTNEEANM